MTRRRLVKLIDPRMPLRRLPSLVRRHSAVQTRKTALLSPALVCQAARQTHTSRRAAGKELLTFSRPLSLCCSSFNGCQCADVEMVFLWVTDDLRWHFKKRPFRLASPGPSAALQQHETRRCGPAFLSELQPWAVRAVERKAQVRSFNSSPAAAHEQRHISGHLSLWANVC